MKKLLATVAIAAIAAVSTPAFAHPALDSVLGWGTTNPGAGPNWVMSSTVGDDTTTATPTVTSTFTLTGTVAKDCSYYGGGLASHTINLGAIGVRNGDTEQTTTAFNQNGAMSMELTSTSAGCNFNNTVTASKSAQGLVNGAPGGYDSSEFTANIPYTAKVGISKAVDANATGTGIWHGFTVGLVQPSGSMHLGAWRSDLHLQINAPAQTLGLVAGTYTDTVTLTLAVDAS